MLLPLAMVCVKGYEGERRKVPGVRSRRRGFEKQRFFSRRDKKALTSGLWHAPDGGTASCEKLKVMLVRIPCSIEEPT